MSEIERLKALLESQAKALSEAEASNTALWQINGQSSAQIKTLVGQKTEWMDRALAAEARLAEAMKVIERLERLCEQLAATRPQSVYDEMIAAGQAQTLLDLDNARRAARTLLDAQEKA